MPNELFLKGFGQEVLYANEDLSDKVSDREISPRDTKNFCWFRYFIKCCQKDVRRCLDLEKFVKD